VECTLDTGAVVGAEVADAADDMLQVLRRGFRVAQIGFLVRKARFGQAAQVHNDLDQIGDVVRLLQGALKVSRQDVKQQVQVVGDLESCRVGGMHVQTFRLGRRGWFV